MTTNCIAANDSIINVDLAKAPMSQQLWTGRKVSSVLNKDDVSKVILLKAETNPEASIDVYNLMRFIEVATVFEERVVPYFKQWVWEAMIVTTYGESFYIKADLEWLCIVNEAGFGCSRIS